MTTLRTGIKEIIRAQMDEVLKEQVNIQITRELLESLMQSVVDTAFDTATGYIFSQLPESEEKSELKKRVG